MRKACQNEEEANDMLSLAKLQEVPPKSIILLVGPPGSRKTTLRAHQIDMLKEGQV